MKRRTCVVVIDCERFSLFHSSLHIVTGTFFFLFFFLSFFLVQICNGFGTCYSRGSPCDRQCEQCNETADSCISLTGESCGRKLVFCFCYLFLDDGIWCNGVDTCDNKGHCISGTSCKYITSVEQMM
jgi:hypothetical protein